VGDQAIGEPWTAVQRMGLDALFPLRRAEGLVEMELGRFGGSAVQSSLACQGAN
jgi:hypothetical protein